MNKDELIAAIEAAGGDKPAASATKADLEGILAELVGPQASKLEQLAAPGGVTRRKVNRGSTRRMNRALGAFEKACAAFADEIDIQCYVTDEDGHKVGSIDLVKDVRDMPSLASKAVAEITTPVE